jgi:hypothetical protein
VKPKASLPDNAAADVNTGEDEGTQIGAWMKNLDTSLVLTKVPDLPWAFLTQPQFVRLKDDIDAIWEPYFCPRTLSILHRVMFAVNYNDGRCFPGRETLGRPDPARGIRSWSESTITRATNELKEAKLVYKFQRPHDPKNYYVVHFSLRPDEVFCADSAPDMSDQFAGTLLSLIPYERACICGTMFLPVTRTDQRYCSAKCKQKAYRDGLSADSRVEDSPDSQVETLRMLTGTRQVPDRYSTGARHTKALEGLERLDKADEGSSSDLGKEHDDESADTNSPPTQTQGPGPEPSAQSLADDGGLDNDGSPGDSYTPGDTVARLVSKFPQWEIVPSVLTRKINRVAQDMAVPVEVVCQSIDWWVVSAILARPDGSRFYWDVPRRLDKPGNDPAAWLSHILGDGDDPGSGLVSAYVSLSAKKAAELGVDPASFCFVAWLDDNDVPVGTVPPPVDRVDEMRAEREAQEAAKAKQKDEQAARDKAAGDKRAARSRERQDKLDAEARYLAGLVAAADDEQPAFMARGFTKYVDSSGTKFAPGTREWYVQRALMNLNMARSVWGHMVDGKEYKVSDLKVSIDRMRGEMKLPDEVPGE